MLSYRFMFLSLSLKALKPKKNLKNYGEIRDKVVIFIWKNYRKKIQILDAGNQSFLFGIPEI